ncbi:MAG: hypothetical protein V4598_06930 [Bdellovibrionota bacterium]
MKGSSLFIILGLILTGLTYRQASSPSLISYKAENKKTRSLASDEAPKCMRDLYSVETLKNEVRELEEMMDTNRISGQWKHLDLTTLPTSAAVFLKKYGDQLGDKTLSQPIEASACQDIPCLYNALYGTPDGIAGYVHYLWYLRTGSYLAADNTAPDQQAPTAGIYNGKQIPFANYLFEEDELFGFWRLSKLLKAPYSTLTYLKEVQRIPRGEPFEGRNAGACGLAHSDGWVALTDSCLIVYPRSDNGYLFPAVIHELSHQLDFEEGKRLNDDFYRSQMSDYMALTGFEMREYRETNGTLVRQWILKPGSRLVSDYAKNSPQESYAELLAYYIVDGDKIKTKVDQDALNFAANYFQGKSFEFQAQADDWAKKTGLRKTNDVLKSMLTCTTSECMSQAIQLLAQEEMNRIRSQEPDGCRVLSNPMIAQTLPGKIADSLNETSANLLFPNSDDPGIRQKILDNFETILNPEVAYASFFLCHNMTAECYNSSLTVRKGPLLEEFGEGKETLMAMYAETYRFDRVREEVTSFYKSLLSSREGIMKIKSDELWASCKKIPVSDSLPPTGSDYIVRDGYMASSFYNCLNRDFNSIVESALDAVKLREFSPKNPEERAFILSLMKPKMAEIFDNTLKSSRLHELRYQELFSTQHGIWLYNTMRSNRYWVPRGRVDAATIESACKSAAVKLIGGDVFFHLKKDLYKDLLERTCSGIR